jgi:hypothetical protein
MEPLAYTILEAKRVAAGVSRTTLYEEIKAGRLRAVKRAKTTHGYLQENAHRCEGGAVPNDTLPQLLWRREVDMVKRWDWPSARTGSPTQAVSTACTSWRAQ